MNRLLLTATLLMAFVGSAGATEPSLPTPVLEAQAPAGPSPGWAGFYVGGHAGYIWGDTVVREESSITLVGGSTSGFVGGVLGGVNWQFDNLVVGGEGDFGWSNAHGNGVILTGDKFTYDLRWTSHVRARLGYDFNGTLVYVAGGLAIAQLHVQEVAASVRRGGTYLGGSIGAGIEHAFTPQIAGRIEYLYDDFGSNTYTFPDGDKYHASFTGNTVRGAVTFKF
jgi:outer membrane immunogenic protein